MILLVDLPCRPRVIPAHVWETLVSLDTTFELGSGQEILSNTLLWAYGRPVRLVQEENAPDLCLAGSLLIGTSRLIAVAARYNDGWFLPECPEGYSPVVASESDRASEGYKAGSRIVRSTAAEVVYVVEDAELPAAVARLNRILEDRRQNEEVLKEAWKLAHERVRPTLPPEMLSTGSSASPDTSGGSFRRIRCPEEVILLATSSAERLKRFSEGDE